MAQTASQITPPSFSPQPQAAGGGFVIPQSQGLAAPPGAEKLTVRLRGVVLEGGLPALAEAAAALRAHLSGRTVSAAEVFAAARDLEQAYAAAGFPLVRVVLPAQRLRHGADLRLVVIDGVIERVDVSALPAPVRDRIGAVLAPLAGQHGLTQGELERRLLLASDTPGTVLRSTLAPGAAAGASVLVVEARYKAVTGSVGFDNTLSRALGTYSGNLGLDLNSPTGHGETLYVRTFGLPTSGGSTAFLGAEPRNRALAAGVILPLGTDGLTLTLEASDTRTAAKPRPGAPGFASEFSRYSARLRYPVIRGRDFTWNAEGSFDAQEERVDVRVPVQAPFSLDRLRVLRGANEAVWFLPDAELDGRVLGGGVFTGRLTGSFGVDGLGARDAPPAGSHLPALSRQGARPEFQKLDALLNLTQPLAEHLSVALTARGQTSFNQALPRSEQIGLAAPTGLSAFDSGLFQGDEGYVVRGEVQFPFAVPVSLPFAWPSLPAQEGSVAQGTETPAVVVLSPYGFGAFGLVRSQRVTVLERPVVRGAAYGAGVRLGAAPGQSFTNFSVSLEYGRADRSGRLPSEDRFTVTAGLQF